MSTELTGAAKRLKECDFEWTSERWRGGYRVELRANKDLVCIVVKPTFEEAANAALDAAEGSNAELIVSAPELLAENERLRARVAELESVLFEAGRK